MATQTVVLLGGGSAGTGIAEAVVAAMIADGLSEAEALGRVWLVGRQGLVHTGMPDVRPSQRRYAQPRERLAGWPQEKEFGLATVVENVSPTVLIGTTGQAGAFDEGVVRAIARTVDRPAIFPLSNPTSRSEATPADLIAWTEGRALVATGSPFDDVTFRGRRYPIAQCNNAYVFPGLGLGVLASGASRVTDGMFRAAARALAEFTTGTPGAEAPLLPPLDEIAEVSRRVAMAVAEQAVGEGLIANASADELRRRIEARRWTPGYRRFRKAR
jgi:malate dehydrogenase (oxaloacetate-decarboxylating)